jgi:putative hydrolase of the HAD superfamily
VVKKTTCVVFDIDAAARALLGVTGFLDRAFAHFSLGARGDVFDRTLVELGVEPSRELVTRLVHCYRDHVPAINLLPDARQALSLAFAAAGVAVVSDGPAASQSAKVRALGLGRWASPVVLTADCCSDRPKPDVFAFELVQEALAVAPEQCAYVADNPAKDFVGPARLGWRTVRVRRNGGLHAGTDSGDDVEIELGQLTALGRVLGFAR